MPKKSKVSRVIRSRSKSGPKLRLKKPVKSRKKIPYKQPDNDVLRLRTGIRGFDEMLGGGLPKGRVVSVVGSTGTGKSVLMNEFLYRGIQSYDENGVYVTFEEYPEDIIENVKSFGWDYASLMEQKKLMFIEASTDLMGAKIGEINPEYFDFSPLITRIKHGVMRVNARRVVIDGIDAFFLRFDNKFAVRKAMMQLCRGLKGMGVTVIMSFEKDGCNHGGISRYGVEEYVADGVLELTFEDDEHDLLRKLYIRKMKGTSHRHGETFFDISNNGMEMLLKCR